MKRGDLTGQRFGRLMVLGKGITRGRNCYWTCRCDCGSTVDIRTQHLQSGASRSCGCLRTEMVVARVTTHNASYTPEYQSFSGAKNRCTNPKSADYPDYGGRGIEFRFETFADFFDEVGERPQGMSIDRKNNDGHYEPGNVRWATGVQQAANRRPRRVAV